MIAAAGRGKHVLVEKPMAVTLAECRSMVDAAERAGVRLVVGHSHSFDRPILRTREIIESGAYGAVRMIAAQYYTDFLYRLRRPAELDAAQGGGVILNQGAHQVDIVRLLAGGKATSVRALAGRWDTARPTDGAYAALVNFAGGAFASLVYGGYAHFDGDELCDGVTELGHPVEPGRYGAARRRMAGIADSREEAAAKAARSYGGNAQVSYAADNLSHQHFGLVLVSCERADLRPLPNGVMIYADAEAKLDPLPPPAVPRSEVIDELFDAVVARPGAAARRALGDGDTRGLRRDARFGARAPRRRAARTGRGAGAVSYRMSSEMRKKANLARRSGSRTSSRKRCGCSIARCRCVSPSTRFRSATGRSCARCGRPTGSRSASSRDVAGVMEPTTFAALKAMERRGYVVRRAVAGDRRKRQVFLTARGRALEAKLVPLAEAVNAIAVRGVPAADVAATRRTLLAIVDNLAADEARPDNEQRRIPSTRELGRLVERAAGQALGREPAAPPENSMSKLRLTFACWSYDRTRALVDGSIEPDGIDLNPPRPPRRGDLLPDAAPPRVRRGRDVAVVVFGHARPRRSAVHRDSGVSLADVPALVHLRQREKRDPRAEGPRRQAHRHAGIPDDGAGVDSRHPAGRIRRRSRKCRVLHGRGRGDAGATEKVKLDLPAKIRVTPIGPTQTLSQMLADGEIDALHTARTPSTYKSRPGTVRRLFENYVELERDYHRRTRIFPIMHTIVIRRDVYRANPWIAQSLQKAFVEAKRRARANLDATFALATMLPWQIAHVEEAVREMGEDWWPYGLEPNRHVLDTFLRYHHEQGLSKRRLAPDELFAREALEAFRI